MTVAEDAQRIVMGVLTDAGRKPPRVLARLVTEQLENAGLLAPDEVEDIEADDDGHVVYLGDPPSWLRYSKTIECDPFGIPSVPVAVTADRTAAAIRVLGLAPDDVRAVVIEEGEVRVFSYRDTTDRHQTMPILPDKEPR